MTTKPPAKDANPKERARPHAVACLCLFLALMPAACNFGKAAQKSKSTTSTTATPPDSQPVANGTADTKLANTMVVDQTDLPSGWVSVGSSSDNTNAPSDRDLQQCLGRYNNGKTDSATAERTFTQGDNKIDTHANLENTVADVANDLASFRDPKAALCLRGTLEKDLPSTGKFTTSFVPLNAVPVGNNGFAFRLTVHGPGLTVILDFLSISEGRIEQDASLTYKTNPPPLDLEQHLVDRMRQKMHNALTGASST